nr:MAG TPA: hypothetical protein [Caudoviricetes sp.]
MWTKMEHSIKRLAEAMYYQHSVPRRRSYPWEAARHRLRRMSKEEVKERLLQDVHQKRMESTAGDESDEPERDEPGQ